MPCITSQWVRISAKIFLRTIKIDRPHSPTDYVMPGTLNGQPPPADSGTEWESVQGHGQSAYDGLA